MTKTPLEQDWRHWKEKYEIEQRAHEATRRRLEADALIWARHAVVLGRVINWMMGEKQS